MLLIHVRFFLSYQEAWVESCAFQWRRRANGLVERSPRRWEWVHCHCPFLCIVSMAFTPSPSSTTSLAKKRRRIIPAFWRFLRSTQVQSLAVAVAAKPKGPCKPRLSPRAFYSVFGLTRRQSCSCGLPLSKMLSLRRLAQVSLFVTPTMQSCSTCTL